MRKKRVEIYGILKFPLREGQVAFIKEADGLRRTSLVENYFTMPTGETHIYTKNTHYVLRKPLKPIPCMEVWS